MSRAAITKACRERLAAAVDGDRLDIDAECVKSYLADHGADDAPTEPSEQPEKRRRKPLPDRPPDLDNAGFSEELAEYTHHEIAERYGTVRSYKDILESAERFERTRKLRLDNNVRRGLLIERELVSKHLIGWFDAVSKQLLADASKVLVSKLYAMARSGALPEEGEREVREIMSSHLKPAKRRAVKTLREAGAPDE